MKDKITDNYNIGDINNIIEYDKNYIFDYYGKKYIYYKINREVNMNTIIEMSNFLYKKSNIHSNKIIYNKKGELLTDGYCLQEIFDLPNSLDILKIIEFQKEKVLNNHLLYWNEKWMIKVDYLERLVFEHNLVVEDLYYINICISLCENAISYFNNIDLKKINAKVVSHYRLSDNKYNFFNPLNYLYDYEQRDIMEFIKLKIVNKMDVMDDIDYILKIKKWNKNEWQLAICRLIYPSYYIDDIIESIKNKKNHLYDINDYIKKISELIIYIKKYVNIVDIDWITKL